MTRQGHGCPFPWLGSLSERQILSGPDYLENGAKCKKMTNSFNSSNFN
jgi:hypothetical protein